jgi:hypothetical protein
MAMTESKVRRIIKEEAIQVLREAGDFDAGTGKPLTVRGLEKKVHNILSAVDMGKLDDYEERLLNSLFNEISAAGEGEAFMKRLLFKMQSHFGDREFKDEVGSRSSDLPLNRAGNAEFARRKGLQEMRAPGYLNPREPFERIRGLVDEALMNKSFGFSRRVTDRYIDELNKMIDDLEHGGQSGSIEDVGFGSVGPR